VITVSDLLRREVVTESGEKLGHVFDVRVVRRAGSSTETADQQWRVTGVAIGSRGLRERLGFTPARRAAPTVDHDFVPWDAILRQEGKRLIVKDGTEPQ
jgi:sporulation protein YlmC with PRC-barrel domain